MEDENGNRNHPLDYFRWLLKNLSISRLCCVFVYQARQLCDNMCSGLEINDLVILSAHPPDCHASFIYHQKCLSLLVSFFSCSINPSLFELFAQSTKGDVFVFYWVTRNTVNTMMCSPVVSEVGPRVMAQKKWKAGRMSIDLEAINCWIFVNYRLRLFSCSGNFRPMLDNGQPPLFLPPHLASLSSQFTPPLFPGIKGLSKLFQRSENSNIHQVTNVYEALQNHNFNSHSIKTKKKFCKP